MIGLGSINVDYISLIDELKMQNVACRPAPHLAGRLLHRAASHTAGSPAVRLELRFFLIFVIFVDLVFLISIFRFGLAHTSVLL